MGGCRFNQIFHASALRHFPDCDHDCLPTQPMGMIHGEACYQPSLREGFVVERRMGEQRCNGVPNIYTYCLKALLDGCSEEAVEGIVARLVSEKLCRSGIINCGPQRRGWCVCWGIDAYVPVRNRSGGTPMSFYSSQGSFDATPSTFVSRRIHFSYLSLDCLAFGLFWPVAIRFFFIHSHAICKMPLCHAVDTYLFRAPGMSMLGPFYSDELQSCPYICVIYTYVHPYGRSQYRRVMWSILISSLGKS